MRTKQSLPSSAALTASSWFFLNVLRPKTVWKALIMLSLWAWLVCLNNGHVPSSWSLPMNDTLSGADAVPPATRQIKDSKYSMLEVWWCRPAQHADTSLAAWKAYHHSFHKTTTKHYIRVKIIPSKLHNTQFHCHSITLIMKQPYTENSKWSPQSKQS